MNEEAKGLGLMWLHARAAELYRAANEAECAYTTEPMRGVCVRVAAAYRRAAAVLAEESHGWTEDK